MATLKARYLKSISKLSTSPLHQSPDHSERTPTTRRDPPLIAIPPSTAEAQSSGFRKVPPCSQKKKAHGSGIVSSPSGATGSLLPTDSGKNANRTQASARSSVPTPNQSRHQRPAGQREEGRPEIALGRPPLSVRKAPEEATQNKERTVKPVLRRFAACLESPSALSEGWGRTPTAATNHDSGILMNNSSATKRDGDRSFKSRKTWSAYSTGKTPLAQSLPVSPDGAKSQVVQPKLDELSKRSFDFEFLKSQFTQQKTPQTAEKVTTPVTSTAVRVSENCDAQRQVLGSLGSKFGDMVRLENEGIRFLAQSPGLGFYNRAPIESFPSGFKRTKFFTQLLNGNSTLRNFHANEIASVVGEIPKLNVTQLLTLWLSLEESSLIPSSTANQSESEYRAGAARFAHAVRETTRRRISQEILGHSTQKTNCNEAESVTEVPNENVRPSNKPGSTDSAGKSEPRSSTVEGRDTRLVAARLDPIILGRQILVCLGVHATLAQEGMLVSEERAAEIQREADRAAVRVKMQTHAQREVKPVQPSSTNSMASTTSTTSSGGIRTTSETSQGGDSGAPLPSSLPQEHEGSQYSLRSPARQSGSPEKSEFIGSCCEVGSSIGSCQEAVPLPETTSPVGASPMDDLHVINPRRRRLRRIGSSESAQSAKPSDQSIDDRAPTTTPRPPKVGTANSRDQCRAKKKPRVAIGLSLATSEMGGLWWRLHFDPEAVIVPENIESHDDDDDCSSPPAECKLPGQKSLPAEAHLVASEHLRDRGIDLFLKVPGLYLMSTRPAKASVHSWRCDTSVWGGTGPLGGTVSGGNNTGGEWEILRCESHEALPEWTPKGPAAKMAGVIVELRDKLRRRDELAREGRSNAHHPRS